MRLIRQELPIQFIEERSLCTAIVPVHLDILKLSPSIRTDRSLLDGAAANVKQAYNEDMAYHLSVLEKVGIAAPPLRGYEKFKGEWQLGGVPDGTGFLTLNLVADGGLHPIQFIPTPLILHNQHKPKKREFFAPEDVLNGKFTEHFSRIISRPNVVYMHPEKMRHYSVEDALTRIDEENGIAEVTALAFHSYYTDISKAILLRDFAVFYLNRLLEKVEEDIVVTQA